MICKILEDSFFIIPSTSLLSIEEQQRCLELMKMRLERKFLKKLDKLNRKDQIRILAKLKMFGRVSDLIKFEMF